MIPRFFDRVHSAVGPYLSADADALQARLSEIVIAVECPDASSSGDQMSVELLVNQLARLYPRLCLFGSESGVEAATSLVRRINPGVEVSGDPLVATAAVRSQRAEGPPSVVMSTDGWSAFIGERAIPSARAVPNALASAFAAGLAASALFRRVILGDATAFEEVHVDLWAFGAGPSRDAPSLEDVDVGAVTVAGLGAVGSAALWTLSRIPGVRGELLLLDPESLELSNLQRYVLAYDQDEGIAKTDMAVRCLAGVRGLTTRTVRGELESATLAERIPLMLVAVDSVGTRRCAQALLPQLVVNGWTSESGLGASWHDFSSDQACMSCLYHPTTPAPSQTDVVARSLGLTKDRAAALWVLPDATLAADDLESIERALGAEAGSLRPWRGKRLREVYAEFACGVAPIPLQPRARREVVPLVHQSVLAGVLACSELVKRARPEWKSILPTKNLIAWHDVTRAPPHGYWLHGHRPASGCICGDEIYRGVHAHLWGPGAPDVGVSVVEDAAHAQQQGGGVDRLG